MLRISKTICKRLQVPGVLLAVLILLGITASTFRPGRGEAETGNWSAFVHAVPSSDGTAIDVFMATDEQVGPVVYATTYQPDWEAVRTTAMTRLSEGSADDYSATFSDFAAQKGVEGWIQITTTLTSSVEPDITTIITSTLDTGPTSFKRAYVSVASTADLFSSDGLLALHLDQHSFPADAYLIVMPTNGLPAPLPVDRSIVGRAYALRASGAVIETEKPVLLRLHFDPEELGGRDPGSLHILAWDSVNSLWTDIGGTVSLRDNSVSQAINALTVYVLAACDPDLEDIMAVAGHWRCHCGEICYDRRYDLDGDCDIDIVDIMQAVTSWEAGCS